MNVFMPKLNICHLFLHLFIYYISECCIQWDYVHLISECLQMQIQILPEPALCYLAALSKLLETAFAYVDLAVNEYRQS